MSTPFGIYYGNVYTKGGWRIWGIQEAQRDNNLLIAKLQPNGEVEQTIKDLIIGAHRHVIQITHVITGSLRASHRMEFKGLRGRIYIDPTSVNPKTRNKPVDYGIVENARGGIHAFYDRTVDEYGRTAENAVFKVVDK